uniref:Uncharacterized protein n=1 Tax=Myoviridae sp. ctj3P51 TaxID=2826687 RepID=A0A8S5NP64_9CAUD|nr:MAG TPA: hypothetical protein [Myoviridae sp. ctj3P51]
MENYIMLDGKKIMLTEEQVAQLRNSDSASKVSRRFNPFDRTEGSYWYCMTDKKTLISVEIRDDHDMFDNEMYDDIANYFNNKNFAMYVALNQLLYRKLLQYAYDNDIIDNNPWNGSTRHYFIVQSVAGRFFVNITWNGQLPCNVYFKDEDSANQAIKDVVEPFMHEHRNFRFVW